MDFLYFLGRFHVLALHLPIGIVVTAVAVDWLARGERFRPLARVAPFLWGAAAISAVLTAALGYLHLTEGKFAGGDASAHRFFGTTLAVLTIALAWLAARRPELYRRLNVVTGVAALALVTVTGHFGGNLTHGSAFLFAYAPAPLRALAGADGEATSDAVDNATAHGADDAVIDRLYRAGFLARAVSRTDPRLIVSIYSPGTRLAQDQWAVLRSAAAQIIELNLQDAGLDDNEVPGLDEFTALTRLRLSRNRLTDATVPIIARLPEIERLNLYANVGITDASVEALASMKALRRVDLWETGMTPAGFERLQALRPDVELQAGTAGTLSPRPAPGTTPPPGGG
jgi:uncharacterized membrane protein